MGVAHTLLYIAHFATEDLIGIAQLFLNRFAEKIETILHPKSPILK